MDHADYLHLKKAHGHVKKVAETLENQSADALSITKVMELASSFQMDGNSFKLVVPHRRFISEEDGILISDHSPTVSIKYFQFLLSCVVSFWKSAVPSLEFNLAVLFVKYFGNFGLSTTVNLGNHLEVFMFPFLRLLNHFSFVFIFRSSIFETSYTHFFLYFLPENLNQNKEFDFLLIIIYYDENCFFLGCESVFI